MGAHVISLDLRDAEWGIRAHSFVMIQIVRCSSPAKINPPGTPSLRHLPTNANPLLRRSSSDYCSIIRSRSRGLVTTETARLKAATIPRCSSALVPVTLSPTESWSKKKARRVPPAKSPGVYVGDPQLDSSRLVSVRFVHYPELEADIGSSFEKS